MEIKHGTPNDGLSGLDDPDAYLADLLDRLFVRHVDRSHRDVEAALAETSAELQRHLNGLHEKTDRLRTTLDDLETGGRDHAALTQRTGDALRTALRSIHEQGKRTDAAVAEVLQILRAADAEDRVRDETTHVAVETVRQRVDALGEAEITRDEMAQQISQAVHADIAEVKTAVKADVKGALGAIEAAVAALATEEGRRSETTAAELARLRQWTLAATLIAAAALLAVLVSVFLRA